MYDAKRVGKRGNRASQEDNGKFYLEILDSARAECNIIVRHVDQKVAVTYADAAVASHYIRALVVERRGLDTVCKGAAMA